MVALVRSLTWVLVVILFSLPGIGTAAAATTRPTALGVYSAWTAATFRRGGHLICYVFSMPRRRTTAHKHRSAVLMVSRTRGSLPLVSFSSKSKRVSSSTMSVGKKRFPLRIIKGNGFAQNSEAVVHALERGLIASISSRAHRTTLADNFSLRGFTAAYAAIQRECPS